jgi:predicted DNA-binding transcriptional regulator YafY
MRGEMRADRLLSLLMLLQSRGRLTAAELAEELEVSERTIYRDVTALGTSGVPVVTEPGPGGGISLLERYRSDLTGLTSDEVQALFMLSIPAPLMDLGLDRRLKGALRKLSAALPAALKGHERRVRQRIHIDGDGWEQAGKAGPHLLTLQQAVWGDNKLEIQYRSFLGSRAGSLAAEVDPFGLVAKAGAWYLVAYRVDHIAVLQVERILRARLSEMRFERPANFDLVSFWRVWCVENQGRQPRFEVTVRVSEELRQYMSTVFGNAIVMEKGAVNKAHEVGWSTWQLMFSSFEEARGRILALGRAVEVVEPLPLRLSVIDFARQITGLYKED